MIANDTPKVPGQFWEKVFFDHLQLFWSPLFDLHLDLHLSHLMIWCVMIWYVMIWWDDMMDFAAANAAATTRLSVGNEQVFRNFTPEKWLVFFMFAFFGGEGGRGPRPRPVQAIETKKFSGILPLKNDMNFMSFLYFWPRLRPRPRPVQAIEMKQFS